MEQLSRVYLYQNVVGETDVEVLSFTANVNLEVLEGIETLFLSTDIGNQTREYDYIELIEHLRRNLFRLEEFKYNNQWGNKVKELTDTISDIIDKYEGKSQKSGRNLFNKVINELTFFNDSIIERKHFNVEEYPRENRTQVFLSHAYSDKTYTWKLFNYFYKRGIYLYVDWMHKDKEQDGRKLKRDLQEQIRNSEQLLFLRTLNSELDIQGKQYLRPWCSWELGSFYNGNNPEEKYLLNLYSVDEYQNVQLHGLKLYKEVYGKRLQGDEIEAKENMQVYSIVK